MDDTTSDQGPEDAGSASPAPVSEAATADEEEGRAPTKRRPLVIHPIMMAAFPVVFLWAHNLTENVTWSDVRSWLFATVLISAVLWGIGTLIFKSAAKAGLAVSIFLLMFFSYGYISHFVEAWHVGGVRIGANRYLMPVWGLLTVAGIYLAVRGGTWLAGVTTGLNVVITALVLLNVGQIVLYQLGPTAGTDDFIAQGDVSLPASVVSNAPAHPRDVYYIVLDEYAGSKTLSDEFGFDNSQFTNSLSSKGFYVAPDSVTNYPRTELAVASSMNMRYLNFLTAKMGTNTGDTTPIAQMIKYADIGTVMQQLGYDYVHIGSWWKPTKESPEADHNLTYGGLSEFSRLMFGTSALTRFSGDEFRHAAWKTTLYEFDQMTQLEKYPAPRFVFAHILCPHDPLVFGLDGHFVSDAEEATRSKPQNYVNQLAWVNRRVLQLVGDLLDRPESERPIIVIQSDEGPYPGEPTMWEQEPDPGIAEQKFDILNAYYFPGVSQTGLYPTITPVNTFRVLLDTYFRAGLGLLPDRAYTFADYHKHLYDFNDVTRLVQPLSDESPSPSPSPGHT
jgi:Sulfatase